MATRLALAGVVLIIAGVVDLGGLGMLTTAVGAIALAASGVAWVTARRGGSS
jgi:hypothetical protein